MQRRSPWTLCILLSSNTSRTHTLKARKCIAWWTHSIVQSMSSKDLLLPNQPNLTRVHTIKFIETAWRAAARPTEFPRLHRIRGTITASDFPDSPKGDWDRTGVPHETIYGGNTKEEQRQSPETLSIKCGEREARDEWWWRIRMSSFYFSADEFLRLLPWLGLARPGGPDSPFRSPSPGGVAVPTSLIGARCRSIFLQLFFLPCLCMILKPSWQGKRVV